MNDETLLTLASQPASLPAISAAVRQTLLWRFCNPDHARAVAQVGAILDDFVDETYQNGQCEDFNSTMRFRLWAVAGDLCFVASFLADVGVEGDLSDVTPEVARLSRKAEGWSRRALKLACASETALGTGIEGPRHDEALGSVVG